MYISHYLKISSAVVFAALLSGCTATKDTECCKEAAAPAAQPAAPVVTPAKPAAQPLLGQPKKPADVLKTASVESEESADSLVMRAEKMICGLGMKQNVFKALQLFRAAADKGSGYACRRLGMEYSDFAFNDATPRDDKHAREWFEKGTKYGDAESMFYLSQFVFEGRGGPKDEKRGTQLLLKAARANSRAAAHRALKLSKHGGLSLSVKDRQAFYRLDKQLRDGVTVR